MVFSDADSSVLADFAHRGVLNTRNGALGYGNSIECIRIKQIFVNPSSTLESASQMTSFDFISPRIVSFDFDELSHETNDVSLLTMTFDYDWMEMVKVGPLGIGTNEYNVDYNITVPGVEGAPSDITPNHVGANTGARSAAGGNGSALGNALTGILGRGASQLTSDAIGKLVKTVGGNGRFATALGGAASSALSGPIGGLVSGGARDLFNNASIPNLSNAHATAQIVVDSSTAGPDRALSVVRSSQVYAAEEPTPEVISGAPY